MARANPGDLRGTGLLVVAFAVMLWNLHHVADRAFPGWLSSQGAPESNGGDIPGPRGGTGSPGLEYHVPDIVQAHLFGTPSRSPEVRTAKAPETRLRLDLIGLITSSDDRLARAIIGVNGGKVRSYSIGQAIDGTDAAVHAVEQQRVLLKRGEALESLALKRQTVLGPGGGGLKSAVPVPAGTDDPAGSDGAARNDAQTRQFQEKLGKSGLKLPF